MTAIDYKSSPFDEAISFLESRIALPSERWNDFSDSEANAAFWSAGAVDATLVSDLQKSVTRAIQNGVPYDSPEFAAQIAGFSEQYGWDIKGGADWRARLILSQNLRQSYAAGRHDQQFDPDVMKLQPYLQYLHSDSRAPRPAHVALDGKVFRKDDPIVSSIYPPNGFNCGCTMIALSQRQLDRKGLEVESIKLGETLPYVDSNGQTKQAIIKPDDGFNAAPSSNAEQRQAALKAIKKRLPKEWGQVIDKEIKRLAKELPKAPRKAVKSKSEPKPVTLTKQQLIRKIEAEKPILSNEVPDTERLGSSRLLKYGEPAKTSKQAENLILDAGIRLSKEFALEGLVPVDRIKSALGDRVSESQFKTAIYEGFNARINSDKSGDYIDLSKLPSKPSADYKSINEISAISSPEFKNVLKKIGSELDETGKYDGLIPIYQIRRAIGDQVTRADFDTYLKDLQGDGEIQMQGGGIEDDAKDKLEDSIYTKTSGLRSQLKFTSPK